jgi:hypothetical protein
MRLRRILFSRSKTPKIKRFKLYGERNTGTTFMTNLLKRNFSIEFLPGTPDRPNRAERERMMACVEQYSDVVRGIVLDRIGGLENRRALPSTLGWKHMHPPIDLLKAAPELAKETLFIVTVKHPIFWAQSYQRHPINSYFPVRKVGFGEFIRHPFIPNTRDNVDEPYFESIIDFYAAKVEGYRRLAGLGVLLEVVRYEELIQDVPFFLNFVSKKYGIPRQGEKAIVLQTSTKRAETTLEQFQEQYRLDRVAEGVSREDLDFILSRFGSDRLSWLGYEAC